MMITENGRKLGAAIPSQTHQRVLIEQLPDAVSYRVNLQLGGYKAGKKSPVEGDR